MAVSVCFSMLLALHCFLQSVTTQRTHYKLFYCNLISFILADAYFSKMGECMEFNVSAFRTEDVKLSRSGNTVTLTLGTGDQHYCLEKVGSADRSTELASSLFSVAERCAKVDERLAETEKMMETLRRSAASSVNAHVSVFDMTVDSKKRKTQPKTQPMQAGMSVLNPGSKKRPKAKGVQFD